ncbi:hypothetical protein [Segatella albensis]|jgi:hypothetical protein|uniref:hypothetical protein n=1 Tax=Segatella albensis TaxID=77768 RepID=UPI000486F39A|nr:hypothetical protein [Segatella albensis]
MGSKKKDGIEIRISSALFSKGIKSKYCTNVSDTHHQEIFASFRCVSQQIVTNRSIGVWGCRIFAIAFENRMCQAGVSLNAWL